MEIQRYDSAVEVPRFGEEEEMEEKHNTSPCSTPDRSSTEKPANQSRLLSLPPELQLVIWEFAVVASEPLYVNCPCDSSYNGWTPEYYADVERWEKGELHPPWQPPLTRVCRSIRADALPIFYKLNAFQAGYCYETDTDMVTDWLNVIGRENRKNLRRFYFFDANARHDVNCERDLKKVVRGKVIRELGGVMDSKYDGKTCRHGVVFEPDQEEWEAVVMAGIFQEEE